MTKFREIMKRVRFDIFPHDLYIIVSNDVVKSREGRNHVFGECNQRYLAMHVEKGTDSLIFLNYDASEETIAHEAFHCVWSIMRQIGAEHEEEVMAYTLSFVVSQIHDFIAQKWKKKKVKKRLDKLDQVC